MMNSASTRTPAANPLPGAPVPSGQPSSDAVAAGCHAYSGQSEHESATLPQGGNPVASGRCGVTGDAGERQALSPAGQTRIAASENYRPKAAKVWERDKNDWYVEPESATAALLTVEKFHGLTLDPACGQGNIVKTLIAHGYEADGSDIVRRAGDADWFVREIDFLADGAFKPGHCDCIVTNPPFYSGKGTEAFIRKALTIATSKVAIFVDLKFLGSDGRAAGLYAESPPNRIHILTPRPSCPPGEYLLSGCKAGGGTADWCWLVWDLQSPHTGTTFHWLRRMA